MNENGEIVASSRECLLSIGVGFGGGHATYPGDCWPVACLVAGFAGDVMSSSAMRAAASAGATGKRPFVARGAIFSSWASSCVWKNFEAVIMPPVLAM